MPKTRTHYRMVEEDDPDWQRFWDLYPHRVAKKDARKAWKELDPSSALVDRIVTTLRWQVVEWAKKADWYTPPYPASWLRAARWEDEAPKPVVRPNRQMSETAAQVFQVLLGDEGV